MYLIPLEINANYVNTVYIFKCFIFISQNLKIDP